MHTVPVIERRNGEAAHLHSGSARRTLAGYAALFDTLSIPVSVPNADGSRTRMMRETIAPGAFRTCLARGDSVAARLDHEPRRFLGTTFDRTLRLREDSRGLAFELDLPSDYRGDAALALLRQGKLSGVSLAFIVFGEEHVLHRGERIRRVKRATLDDVSLVSLPRRSCYPGTTVYERTSGSWPAALVGRDDQARRRRLEALERELGQGRRSRLHALECELGLS